MQASLDCPVGVAVSRTEEVQQRAARRHMRKWLLVWMACAALCWAATIVVGYSVMRFSGALEGERMEASATGESIDPAEAEALSTIAPAAGGTSATDGTN